jgi:RNA polymerase sigma-70 factor (ECF subfamily)
VSQAGAAAEDPGTILLTLYDRAVPQVYGYLLPRCGNVALAEDLTAETFMAAVDAVRRDTVPSMSVAWLIGVARHKLDDEPAPDDDPWDAALDAARARDVLSALGAHHRAALTLRYLDGLSVPEVAEHLGRTVHATEALLVRARIAFRRAYEEACDDA